jgi:hypothetical protein
MHPRIRIVALAATTTVAIGCAAAPAPDRRVFETSQQFTGDLIAAAGDPSLDGPAAADLLCNRVAQSTQLGGTWTAWVSVGDGASIGLDPAHPGWDVHGFDHASYNRAAIDRIVGDGPWVGTDPGRSATVFSDRAGLAAGVMHDLFFDEQGRGAGYLAWTGTRNGGQPTSNDCVGWSTEWWDAPGTHDANRGTAGREISTPMFDNAPTWTDDPTAALLDDASCTLCPDPNIPAPADPDAAGFGTVHCTDSLSLYCFEN